jgi:hypothetical protein
MRAAGCYNPRHSNMSRATASSIAACTLVIAAVLYRFDPATTAWLPSCPLYTWTGWLCPGCGTLRALHALLHLDVVQALRYNAFTAPVMAAGAATLGLRRPIVRHPSRWVAAAAVFGVLRNVPMAALAWLRP